MKLTAMAHVTALAIQMNVQNEVGRVDTMTEEGMENSMILVTVNQGFTEEVMETARKAGAAARLFMHAGQAVKALRNFTELRYSRRRRLSRLFHLLRSARTSWRQSTETMA